MTGGVTIEHPNRDRPASRLARLLVVAFLLASALVVLVVAVGGWAAIEGAKPVQIAFVVVYAALASFVARWSRGALPLIAALAVILAIFAAVAAPAWFDRARDGFTDPALSSDLLGVLCALLVPLQLALALAALIGFRQRWNIEVERPA